jgi:FkbM family methyltransferase
MKPRKSDDADGSPVPESGECRTRWRVALVTFANKLRWLFSHPTFSRHPISVLLAVLKWEWIRKRGQSKILPLTADLRFKVRPFDGMGRMLCYFGLEADEMFGFMNEYLKPGMVVVDVGANIGTHSIYSARLIGEGGKVVAIEADSETAKILRDNISLNHVANVGVLETCVSDQPGTVLFNVNCNSAKSSIVYAGESTIPVNAQRMVDLLPHELQIDFLKIDVEGADYLVLIGSREIFTLRPPSVVVAELSSRKEEICRFLTSYDYELFDYRAGRLVPRTSEHCIQNIYALHSSIRKVLANRGWSQSEGGIWLSPSTGRARPHVLADGRKT